MVALRQPTFSWSPASPSLDVQPRARRVAVVLNANARKVDERTMRWMRAVVPAQDLHVSYSLEEAERIAARIVAAGYDAVLWGGGDGTFGRGIALTRAAARRMGRRVPEMGTIRLGTGNAIADAIGAAAPTQEGVTDDLRRARAGASRRRLPLLDVDGTPAMFCGFGLDAQILDDFGRTVEGLKKIGLADAVESADARYALSVASRSIPRFLLTQRTEIVAINRGAPAIEVDVDGKPVGSPIASGRVLWRGKASLCSAGTIPFYGLGMRIFPHADRMLGRFQLRMTDVNAVQILSNLPKIWRGRFSHPRLHDFLVDDVELVLSRPSPLQANGDLLGERDRLRLSFDESIPVV